MHHTGMLRESIYQLMESSSRELRSTMPNMDPLWKTLNIDSDHLYRHLTEVNGRDTRGGYIEGMIEFQEQLLLSSFALKISLVSAGGADKRFSNVVNTTSKRLHPNLLYMTR